VLDIFPQIPSSASFTPHEHVSWTPNQLNKSFNKSRPVDPDNFKTENTFSSTDSWSQIIETKVVHHTIGSSRLGKKWPATKGETLILTMGDPDHSDSSFEYDYSTDSDDSEGSYNFHRSDNENDSLSTTKSGTETRQYVASQHLNLARELLNLELAEAKLAKQAETSHSVQFRAQNNVKRFAVTREEFLEPKWGHERAVPVAKKQRKMRNDTWECSKYVHSAPGHR
jgi:hypothetical protein